MLPHLMSRQLPILPFNVHMTSQDIEVLLAGDPDVSNNAARRV
jgi:hypothetical protein